MSMHGYFYRYDALKLYTSHPCVCWRIPLAQHILSAHHVGDEVRRGHAAPVLEHSRQDGRLLHGVGFHNGAKPVPPVASQREVEHLADRRPTGIVVNNTID